MAVEVGKRVKGGPNIPFGAKVITGAARAINGVEVEQGIFNLLKQASHELGLDEQELGKLFEAKKRQWPELGKLNVAFPMLQIAVWGWVYEDGAVGAKILMRTDSQRHKEMLIGVEDRERGVRKEYKCEIGPEARPDDMREKLGLTILIEIELPDGKRDMVEAPTMAAPTIPEPKKVNVQEVINEVLKPDTPGRDMTEAELVADLPKLEVEKEEPRVPIRRPKIEIGKGAK